MSNGVDQDNGRDKGRDKGQEGKQITPSRE